MDTNLVLVNFHPETVHVAHSLSQFWLKTAWVTHLWIFLIHIFHFNERVPREEMQNGLSYTREVEDIEFMKADTEPQPLAF